MRGRCQPLLGRKSGYAPVEMTNLLSDRTYVFLLEKRLLTQNRFVISTGAKRSGGSAPWKGGAFQREIAPPGNWFVPPGNNRSSGGGNEVAEAFGGKGRESDSVSVQAVRRVNVEQASKDAMQEPTHLSPGEGRS
jgi:hypothetical protein